MRFIAQVGTEALEVQRAGITVVERLYTGADRHREMLDQLATTQAGHALAAGDQQDGQCPVIELVAGFMRQCGAVEGVHQATVGQAAGLDRCEQDQFDMDFLAIGTGNFPRQVSHQLVL